MPVPSLPKIDPVVLEKRKGKGFLKLLDVFIFCQFPLLTPLGKWCGLSFKLNPLQTILDKNIFSSRLCSVF